MARILTVFLTIFIIVFSCSSVQPPDYTHLVDTGNLDSARVLIEDVLTASHGDPAALTALLKLYYFKGDYDKCKATYNKLPDKNAAPYAAHLYRAFCHDRDREYDQAVSIFKLAVAGNPRMVPLSSDTSGYCIKNRYYLGQNNRTLNMLARNSLAFAQEQHPDDLSLMALQAEAFLQHYTLYGRTDADYLAEAEKITRRLKRDQPEWPAALLLLARLAEKATDSDGYYRAAVSAKPEYTPAFCAYGDHLLKFGAPQRADSMYDAALETDSSQIKGLLGKGFVALKTGDPEKALGFFDRALAVDRESAVAYYNRGVALGQLKKANDAISSYQAALMRNPQMVDALYNLGRTYYLCYKYNQAKVVLDRAIYLAPAFADAYIMQGNTFLKLGERDKAKAVLQAVLLKDPDNKLAKQNLLKLGK